MGLLLEITESKNEPKYRQIVRQVSRLVETGVMPPGARMPSSREMAETLGLNRSTVYRAYQELWALGYIESSPGTYSTIRRRSRTVDEKTTGTQSLIDWDVLASASSRLIYGPYLHERELFQGLDGAGYIDFSVLSPDPSLFPLDVFRKKLNQVMVNFGEELLEYGDPRGYGPLREYISERMRMHSVHILPEEILITTGAQNGIELIVHLLAGQGDSVVFESPTYSRAIDLFHMHGVTPVAVPMLDTGMDLDILEDKIREHTIKMIYTIPNFQNPTGITSIQRQRERLITICEKNGIPLIEDGFEEEMKYFGKAVLPVKSMDKNGVVIYVGTFSKVLFPGIRVGWVAADRECIERLIPLKRASSLSGNQLSQAALEQFCRQGYYDLHIKRMHRLYRKRMLTALKCLQAQLGNMPVYWTPPAGGYTIWLRIPGMGDREDALVRRLIERGVVIMPGSPYYIDDHDSLYLRLSIAQTDEREIQTGTGILRDVLSDMLKGQ